MTNKAKPELNIMLDLETLSTENNAAILSISAVLFSMGTGEIHSEFEHFLKVQPQIEKGAIIDADTVFWWLRQDDEARASLAKGQEKAVMPLVAVQAFVGWLNYELSDDELETVGLYGNGIGADNIWLRNLFAREGITFPLAHWRDRDMRTLIDLFNAGGIKANEPFIGIKHNGLDDCKHQIKICVKAVGRGL